jgi:hypothetical protein
MLRRFDKRSAQNVDVRAELSLSERGHGVDDVEVIAHLRNRVDLILDCLFFYDLCEFIFDAVDQVDHYNILNLV